MLMKVNKQKNITVHGFHCFLYLYKFSNIKKKKLFQKSKNQSIILYVFLSQIKKLLSMAVFLQNELTVVTGVLLYCTWGNMAYDYNI